MVAARDLSRAFSIQRIDWRSTEISKERIRVNEQIRISPVRLIQDDGEQIGIVSMDEARERAAERGMDLVEVAPEARPPVVKMMDYGKYKYEAARAARESRKKQHVIQVKEVKFRPGIEDHEYPQCFYELEYAHGDAVYCDDECCWWEFKSCGVMYCNDHPDECEWKKDFDSCVYEPQ